MIPFFSICLAAITATAATAAPAHLVDQSPANITRVSPGVSQVDFGRVAFGNLSLNPPDGADATITVHFGEALVGNRINRKPPGTVRYSSVKVKLRGSKPVLAAPPADKRNTEQGNGHPPAFLTPPEWGVVTPFRWVEIEGWPGELQPQHITRRAAFSSTWGDDASAFQSSNETLDGIWDLCRYSIKATTFAGIYVDGDRERIPYEADAYLNQLSHYAVEGDIQMARDTFDHLMKHPTWPTEWASHMIFMAHADWMHSGDTKWLAPRYEELKKKLLLDRTRPDGLVVSNKKQVRRDDIVDWPVGERDGFVFTPVNTVINAFHLRSLKLMADMARALGKSADAANYTDLAKKAYAAFQETLFDADRGLYRDGEGTDHHSLHANLFPLAFDLVPKRHRSQITEWLGERGMACSVYAAQYLMEALFKNEAGGKALELILADNDRSWKHMLESGTTITWEAWDQKYKPNQDWNHAWGAAPANLLPYFVLGVRPLAPGWSRVLVSPNPGDLESASGKIPTPLGPVLVDWKNGGTFTLKLNLPEGMSATVELPASDSTREVFSNGKELAANRIGSRWVLDSEVTGIVTLEVRR